MDDLAKLRKDAGRQPEVASGWLKLASSLLEVGKVEQAKDTLLLAVSLTIGADDASVALEIVKSLPLDVSTAVARVPIGVALERAGQTSSALDCALSAVEGAPDYADAHRLLARLYDALGGVDESLECLRQVVGLDPDDVHASIELASKLAAVGRRREALMFLGETAYRVSPAARDQLELGRAFAMVGAEELAARHLSRAIEQGVEDADTLLAFGAVARVVDRSAEAVEALERSLRLGADPIEASYQLALALMSLGDSQRARHVLVEMELTAAGDRRLRSAQALLELLEEAKSDADEPASITAELSTLTLPEVLEFVFFQRMTGVLTLSRAEAEARFELYRGQIVGADASGCASLLERLAQQGELTAEQVESVRRSLETDPGSKLLAAHLLREATLSEEEVEHLLFVHTTAVVKHVLTWRNGTLRFAQSTVDASVPVVRVDPRRALSILGPDPAS